MTITIDLTDDQARRLKEMADRFGISPEDLVSTSVEDLIAGPEERFHQAFRFVLKKNADLYDRLA